MWKSPLGRFTGAFDTSPFERWCNENKVLLPSLRFSSLEETGRCVLAAKDITEGDVVVEVPDGAVLMAETSGIARQLAGEGRAAALGHGHHSWARPAQSCRAANRW